MRMVSVVPGRLHLSADAVEAPREQRHEDHEQER